MMMPLPAEARVFAVVPAAGVGARMGAGLPKQYLSLAGRTLAEHTLGRLLSIARIEKVLVAVAEGDPWWPSLPLAGHARIDSVTGGSSRAESVLNALLALSAHASEDDWVLVHDMARPCLRPSDVDNLFQAAGPQGAILALPATDTIKRAEDDCIAATLPRETVWRALTPQLFPLGLLREAMQQAISAGVAVTDEASAVEHLGYRPTLVTGRGDNLKVTQPDDLALAAFYLARQQEEGEQWHSA
jgi:2-C-methyl-D-erythritol 4-phosphate cytidylyltransferase